MDREKNRVIGETLKRMRREQGLTQGQVAQILRTSQSVISATESGKRGLQLVEAMAYSLAINVKPIELFEEVDQSLHEAGLV